MLAGAISAMVESVSVLLGTTRYMCKTDKYAAVPGYRLLLCCDT